MISDSLKPAFSKSINILLLEDDPLTLAMLSDTLFSPFSNIFKAKTPREAEMVLNDLKGKWHCWIVELYLRGNDLSGHTIIESHPEFPYSIVYSGLRSMESAAKAVQSGAAAVIDKGPDSTEKLVFEVCRLTPLALLCTTKLYTNKNIFWLLLDSVVEDPHGWAEQAAISLRQLENITKLHTGLSPSLVIAFYYGFRYALLSSLPIGKNAGIMGRFDSKREFFERCIFTIHRNMSLFREHL